MARGRMISASIAISESVDAMTEWAQLAFVFALPHLDDFGIIPGSPAKLKATTKPLSKRPASDFADAAAEWIAAGIFTAFAGTDGRVYLRAVNFDTYQTGLHKRTRSRFPTEGTPLKSTEYSARVSGDSGKFPESPATVPELPLQQNRTEQKGTEEEQKRSSVAHSAPHLFSTDSDAFRLSKLLFDLIRGHRNEFKDPGIQKWAKQMDLLLRVDGRDAEETELVIRYAQGDSFWRGNILCPKKLREKYDQLAIQMTTNRNGTKRAAGTNHDAIREHFAGR